MLEPHIPKKSLSQNFLIDHNIIRKQVASVTPNDQILEIGPGKGALTYEMLKRGATVYAVEKDERLFDEMKKDPNLHLFCADFLEWSMEHLPEKNMKVIANLPYQITAPILGKLVEERARFSECILMVQDEVADRMIARVGSSDYSSLTVFLNFYAKVEKLFKVSNRCFSPVPKVTSAVVRISFKHEHEVADTERFFQMVRCAFNQKRKMIRGSLQKIYDREKIVQAISMCGFNENVRPQELTVDQFIQLFHKLL